MDNVKPIDEAQRRFIRELTENQVALFSYICVALGNGGDAADILQETNVQLWVHASEYDASRPFLPWARAFAFNQIRAFLKTCSRERLVFSEELVCLFAENISEAPPDRMEDIARLRRCMEKLDVGQRALIRDRYWNGQSVDALSRRLRRSADAVYVQLHRIRRLLADCIRRETRREAM